MITTMCSAHIREEANSVQAPCSMQTPCSVIFIQFTAMTLCSITFLSFTARVECMLTSSPRPTLGTMLLKKSETDELLAILGSHAD